LNAIFKPELGPDSQKVMIHNLIQRSVQYMGL